MKTLFHFSILILTISSAFDDGSSAQPGNENQLDDQKSRTDRMEKEIIKALYTLNSNKNATKQLIREAIESKYSLQMRFKQKFENAMKNERTEYYFIIKKKNEITDRRMKRIRDRTIALEKIMQNETNWTIDYVKKLSCPRRLKYCLTELSANYGGGTSEEQSKARRNAELSLLNLLEPSAARSNLSSCVRQFSDPNTTSATFENAWTVMKNLPGGLHSTPAPAPVDHIDGDPKPEFDESDKNSTLLRDALLDLHKAVSPGAAEQIWKNQRDSVWQPRSTYQNLTWEDEGVVRWLTRARKKDYPVIAYEATFATGQQPRPSQQQFWYALDVLENEKLNFHNSHYKSCLWTVYDRRVVRQLMRLWPHLDRAKRTDLYCTQYELFYDMTSLLSYDSSNKKYPEPALDELKDYVWFLCQERGTTAAYVARTLFFNFKDT